MRTNLPLADDAFEHGHRDRLATNQVIQCGSTDVEKSLAEYLRAWRWDAENPNDNCRSFSLIVVAIWLQGPSRSLRIAGGKRFLSNWRRGAVTFSARAAGHHVNYFNVCLQWRQTLKFITPKKVNCCARNGSVLWIVGGR
jgi:hypothetical protein